uniref:enoyl-CoA hydratase/isomerase family protein n=1 Tax=Vibrio sp. TaxID=678 RepID=UPI003D0FE6F0
MSDNVTFELVPCRDGKNHIAIATLDNPSSLNALSLNMLDLLYDKLQRWQSDDQIVCVVLTGSGEKAFCAGGDVRAIYRVMRDNEDDEITRLAGDYF